MFIMGVSEYSALVFSLLTMLVAVPSAIKVFNWVATLYKGSITFEAPMIYAYLDAEPADLPAPAIATAG